MPAAGRLNRRKSQLNLPDPVPWSKPQTYRPAGRGPVAGENLESLPAVWPPDLYAGQLDLVRCPRFGSPAYRVKNRGNPPKIRDPRAAARAVASAS